MQVITMSIVNFINDAYTEDGLKLPMVNFPSLKKRYLCYMHPWYVWFNY